MLEDERDAIEHVLEEDDIRELYHVIVPRILKIAEENGIVVRVNPSPGCVVDCDAEVMASRLGSDGWIADSAEELQDFRSLKYGRDYFSRHTCTKVIESLMIREKR